MGIGSWRFHFSFSENRWQGVNLQLNLQFINFIGDTFTNLVTFFPFVSGSPRKVWTNRRFQVSPRIWYKKCFKDKNIYIKSKEQQKKLHITFLTFSYIRWDSPHKYRTKYKMIAIFFFKSLKCEICTIRMSSFLVLLEGNVNVANDSL